MKKLLLAAFVAFPLAGCVLVDPDAIEPPRFLIADNYQAADALVAIAGPRLAQDKPILVATVADIDDLDASSTLGRWISESVSARFTQSRYRMVEMKLQNAVYMKRNEGEFMLTRQVREIAASHQAQAIVVGTYSRARHAVFVNLKVVRPETNVVIAAYDYALPMNRDVCDMVFRDPRRCPET